MSLAARRRSATRFILLDRSLEPFPLFRLSDAGEDAPVSYHPPDGGRWRVLPGAGGRLPGTFDQDVYVELARRYQEVGAPADGIVSFTLHAFLRSIGRRADGRSYEQLRSALSRLEHTKLESQGVYFDASSGTLLQGRFTVLTAVKIDRRRIIEKDQLALFPAVSSAEPGEACVTFSPIVRGNIRAGHTVTLSVPSYISLGSPVARRLYRLLEWAREEGNVTWRVPLERLAVLLPLAQRYPSHLQRVLQPAHEMLLAAGLLRDVSFGQRQRDWHVDYVLAARGS